MKGMVAVLGVIWGATAAAQPLPPGTPEPETPGLSIGVIAGPRLGNTTFRLKHTEYVAEAGGDVTVESRLNWPADFLMVGAHARWVAGNGIGFTAVISTNAHSPLGDMDDSDWISAPAAGVPRTKFAYTESNTKARAIIGDVSLRTERNDRWHLLGGYHHEYYRGDGWGADGWVDLGDGRNDVGLDDDIHAIHFESQHFMPYIGARFRDLYEGRLFAVYVHDYDDHVLRFKEGTGRSFGAGLSAAARPRWAAGARTIGIDVEVQYVRAHWGTLEQRFYADDPATPENELATEIPDSDYLAGSLHVSALFVAELGL